MERTNPVKSFEARVPIHVRFAEGCHLSDGYFKDIMIAPLDCRKDDDIHPEEVSTLLYAHHPMQNTMLSLRYVERPALYFTVLLQCTVLLRFWFTLRAVCLGLMSSLATSLGSEDPLYFKWIPRLPDLGSLLIQSMVTRLCFRKL